MNASLNPTSRSSVTAHGKSDASGRRDSLIAAVVTFLIVGLMLIWLLVATLRYDARLASDTRNPQLEEDEIFLDPELLLDNHKSIGEPDAVGVDAPAPEVKGAPAAAPVEQPHTVLSGENTVPSPEQTLITSAEESPVQTVAPDRKREEEKVATSMAGKFGSKPGSVQGKFDSTGGSDGTGSGVTGKMSGRQFLGCPLPDVSLAHKTTVTVSITVDAEGKVMTATASGAATREIRRKCEQAAMQARWSAKKGATSTRGSITFTIIPK
ncbi:MAG: hypothetical protein K2N09_00075, partial [Muribaculaceae bacterium]|nr:hypothetical protein [Muribaculaceae bacterium]